MPNTVVRDVMTSKVVSVTPTTSYKAIVRTLLKHKISAVPVRDGDWHVEGVVSEADLIPKEALADSDQPGYRELLARHAHQTAAKARAVTAGALMSSPAITIGPDAGLAAAARVMSEHAVKRLPVVDSDGVLVGIVSRHDLLSAYLRPDGELREAVIGEILIGAMAVDPLAVDVRVRNGVVTLTGELESEAVIDETVRLVRALDGVVSVDAKLRRRRGSTR
jgi:CBS-domain-containing membrane protein